MGGDLGEGDRGAVPSKGWGRGDKDAYAPKILSIILLLSLRVYLFIVPFT